MATVLKSFGGRQVFRCDACRLVQFPTVSGRCRRCHSPYEPAPEPIEVAPRPLRIGDGLPIGVVVRVFREAQGLSQGDVARRMQVARSYISKVERAKCEPTLDNVLHLARALDVPVAGFVRAVEIAATAEAC